MDFRIDDYVYFKRHIGVDGLLITGLPGSGKSNQANGIVGICLQERGENFVIPIDRQCEFLNVLPYAKEYEIILPDINEKKADAFHFHKFKYEKNVTYVDYDDLDINDYLNEDSKGKVVAIYDNHFRGKLLHKRSLLWVKIAEQLLDRTFSLENAVGLLFHEAGIYFPEMPIEQHWRAVKEFSEMFVDFRKALIRVILISQMDKEIKHTIRGKCFWRIYRKGFVSKTGNPEPIFKTTQKLALNEYHFFFSGGYSMYNVVDKTPEYNHHVRIVPHAFPKPDEADIIPDMKMVARKLSDRGWQQSEIGELLNKHQSTISRMIKV